MTLTGDVVVASAGPRRAVVVLALLAVVATSVGGMWWWTGRPDIAGGSTGDRAGACFSQRHDVMDLDGGRLHNATRWTARVSAVEPRVPQGVTVREVRVLPLDGGVDLGTYVVGGEHDPGAAVWSHAEVLGPDGYDIEPGGTVQIAMVADVHESGAQFYGTAVSYAVGPFPHQGWYPMYTRVLGSHEPGCTDELYDEMVAADRR